MLSEPSIDLLHLKTYARGMEVYLLSRAVSDSRLYLDVRCPEPISLSLHPHTECGSVPTREINCRKISKLKSQEK